MKNQFDDAVNCSALEIVCFKQIKSCFFDRKTLCDIQYIW